MRQADISQPHTRRRALKAMMAASAAVILPRQLKAKQPLLEVLGREVEIQITSISPYCFCASGRMLEQLKLDQETGVLSFLTGARPLLGLGEGGPQFDRRGSIDRMYSGQAGFELRTHGGRVPIPWLIGTSGWGMFIHHPNGSFDFTGEESKFRPAPGTDPIPLTLFFIASDEPSTILSEYAKLTGFAELPPLWSLGYQQSHRTLASREEVLQEAKTFRQKQLPCDALIYLGTGFCPSGWNTANGSFAWNTKVFPDPERMIHELHQDNFHVVLHTVILTEKLLSRTRRRPSRS